MSVINLIGNDDTPTVVLDSQSGKFEISGRSMPEDVAAFYKPILEWLDSYAANPNPKTEFVFKLNYFNTASSKLLLDVLLKLEDIVSNGSDVAIKWYYPGRDEDMKEAGEEYSEMVEVPFEIIQI